MTLEHFSTLATAITSIVAIALAVITYWHQTRQSSIHLGISILRDCEKDFFYSPEMRRQRLVTARFLLSRESHDQPPPDEAFEVMDFFASLAGYVERKVVPTDLAFYAFYYWYSVYYHLLWTDIEKLHSDHGIRYLEHCESLYDDMTRYARKKFKLPADSVRFSEKNRREFLEEEVESLERWVRNLAKLGQTKYEGREPLI